MSTSKHDFNSSGPSQLVDVHWGNSDHRRIVMASLVQGVYVLQSGEENGGGESQALALARRWWEFFHFKHKKSLRDNFGKSIYGAIYQLNTSAPASNSPKFVVAFRGTYIKKPGIACCQDVRLDMNIFCNNLNRKTRVKQALKEVKHLIKQQSPDVDNSIWLAGHSLGAAIALQVGKKLMTKDQRNLETYLFNPPIVPSLFNCGRPCWTVGLCFLNMGTVVWDFLLCRSNPFDAIRQWVPHLYVHEDDPVCMGYIHYFNNRKRLGRIDETASRVWRGPKLICSEGEPIHLLASAELTVNKKKFSSVSDAHAIGNWWNSEQEISSPSLYKY